jgi:hypothetical protein
MTWRVAYNARNKGVKTIARSAAAHDECFPCRKFSKSFSRALASAAHPDVVTCEAVLAALPLIDAAASTARCALIE